MGNIAWLDGWIGENRITIWLGRRIADYHMVEWLDDRAMDDLSVAFHVQNSIRER